MSKTYKLVSICAALVLVAVLITGCWPKPGPPDPDDRDVTGEGLQYFESGDQLVKAFESESEKKQGGAERGGEMGADLAAPMAAESEAGVGADAPDYSQTNIQVAGVDEADTVKTDGEYIYNIAQGNLVISKAYPTDSAEIISTTKYSDFHPREIFIDEDRVLVFGSESYTNDDDRGKPVSITDPAPRYINMMSAKLYDVSDKASPELLRTVNFEGNYLTARKIGSNTYFVINTFPDFYRESIDDCEEIVPLYWESKSQAEPAIDDLVPTTGCTDVGYVEPLQAETFFTLAAVSMEDENQPVDKEVIVGSGQNVYASLENMYIAQNNFPTYGLFDAEQDPEDQKTIISKFALDDGKINYKTTGDVPGYILNQFSMDEYDDHFRIATTVGQVWDEETKSKNNIYILDSNMKQVGALEDLAPGESIYSARFMGKRGYLVTFKKVDPLFVVDLSDHTNPAVLGKLKIPGYSDYLHPYDANHIIGIGKEAIEAEEDLKEQRQLDFAWYQGIKMAIFDVTDVANPIEMHKEIIGDRGTESEALHNHKALLFDKKKNLMVLPITLAEIEGEKTEDNQYGDTVFQGAYVYDVTLDNGFDLRGRVTHYDDDSAFEGTDYYFYGDNDITRSLYIDSVLYTLSEDRLQLNNLDTLERLKALEFEEGENDKDYFY
ncbi:beta-propeller domain-containing protein [Patescibacteria group bacterium]